MGFVFKALGIPGSLLLDAFMPHPCPTRLPSWNMQVKGKHSAIWQCKAQLDW